MNPRHTTEFTVHLHHLGPNGLARPSLIFDCLQDAASEQSARLGYSIRELIRRGLTWVVSRYRVKVIRYPRWQERFRVTTWRSPQQGHSAPREFALVDADNRTIALARGMFILLDRHSKRPVDPAEHIPGYPVADETVFADDFRALPEVSAADASTRVLVRHEDLDLNRHVNNTRYLTFALESVPGPIMGSHVPDRIDISFLNSAGYGDTIRSLIRQHQDPGGQPRFIHQLVGDPEPLDYCRLYTRWKKMA